jgi:hypothetical protein
MALSVGPFGLVTFGLLACARSKWARLYSTDWDVQFGGVHGRVTASGLDAGASRILAMLGARAGDPADGRVEDRP